MSEACDLEAVRRRVAAAIGAAHPGWDRELATVGQGLEAAVFRAALPGLGTVAVKAPWRRFPGGGYTADIDCRALLRQERVLAEWAAGLGLPVAAPLALHETEAQDLLVSAYVEDDGAGPDDTAFGRLLRRMHAAPPPDIVPVAHGPSGDLATQVAGRIRHRIERLAELGERLPQPDPEALRAALPTPRRSLLHMDLRPVNLRCRSGRILAVIDWSNAVIADPALELARMAEAGTLTDGILDAYGGRDWAAGLPAATRAVFALDATLLLAIVFRVADPDAERAARMSARARELLAAFPSATA